MEDVHQLRVFSAVADNLSFTRAAEVLFMTQSGVSHQVTRVEKTIGEKLFISATTAKFHVSNIMRKLEVSRRAEAVYAASKRGLI